MHQSFNHPYPKLTFFRWHVRRMVTTRAMLVGNGGIALGNHFRGFCLQFLPALQSGFVAVSTPEKVGGIDARSLAIDMRKVGKRHDFFTVVF